MSSLGFSHIICKILTSSSASKNSDALELAAKTTLATRGSYLSEIIEILQIVLMKWFRQTMTLSTQKQLVFHKQLKQIERLIIFLKITLNDN